MQKMSLSVLVDMLVQREYIITILTKALLVKNIREIKIEVFNNASRARMMFVWSPCKCSIIVMIEHVPGHSQPQPDVLFTSSSFEPHWNRLVRSIILMQMKNLLVEDDMVIITAKMEFSCKTVLLGDNDVELGDREIGQGRVILCSTACRLGWHSPGWWTAATPCCTTLPRCCSWRLSTRRWSDCARTGWVTTSGLGITSLIGPAPTPAEGSLLVRTWSRRLGGDCWSRWTPTDPLAPSWISTLIIEKDELTERSISMERLSVESLSVHTIYARTNTRLIELKTIIQQRKKLGVVQATLHD